MKRSEINKALKELEAMCREYKCYLPPFCGFTPEQWQSIGHEYDEVRDCMLGWDITDYGLGDFDKVGMSLITIRNGNRKMADAEVAVLLEKRRILLDGFASKEGKAFPTVLELADDGDILMQPVIGKCTHCGGEIRVGSRAFNCSNYTNQDAPCSFAIWRNIGGHQLTLEEAGEICEKGITSLELEMYREDGSIYRKRLGVSPDKLQIVKI